MSDKQEVTIASTIGMAKYVHVMFFGGAIAVGWLLVNTIHTLWTWLNLTFAVVPPPGPWATVIGGAGAAGLAYYLWRHPKVNKLAFEIVAELSKVTWPTRKELSASTVVVIIFSIIAAIILGLFDFFWAAVTDIVYT
jgi:preprotein translocase subunit SecE